jgi:hypothetical protein
MIRNIVINKTSKKVLKHGLCDFENDGQFDSQIKR